MTQEQFKKGDYVDCFEDYFHMHRSRNKFEARVINITAMPDGRQKVRLRSKERPNFQSEMLRKSDPRINDTSAAFEFFFPTALMRKSR